MNSELRKQAAAVGMSFLAFLLERIRSLQEQGHKPVTLFAACPNSSAVIEAALRAAKKHNAPVKFAATLNQVDNDGGYTGMTHAEFVKTIRLEARRINLKSPVIIAVDHGGPWLKDVHAREKWAYGETMNAVKKSFESAVMAGFDLLHVDPTVDISSGTGTSLRIETVVSRTVELISHVEKFRQKNLLPPIAYEVGTEEVHGGLADMEVFTRFLNGLREGMDKAGLPEVWPVFIVGKVGTDLHTTLFDPLVAKQLTEMVRPFGSVIKGHYTDSVSNPEAYPLSGMGGANVGPEFTECEYDGLMELEQMEKKLFEQGNIPRISGIREGLWKAVITSQRWKKWLQPGEDPDDFYQLNPERQIWLVKTGCRYIWNQPEIEKSRLYLYKQLYANGMEAETILLSHIERAMDKYFFNFNLTGLNDLL